jgi:hypothetical protein
MPTFSVGFFMPERNPMQIIRAPAETVNITDPAIRRLVEQRIYDLGKPDGNEEPFDLAELGYFVIVEAGDSIDTIDAQLGFPILTNRWTGVRFGQPGFDPSFEFVEEFSGCFELVYILDQSGFGIEVFVPKTEGIESELLMMCQRYATPGAV